jgi:3-oxoacid CoA-transferase subunit B
MALRVARELEEGTYVNLGMGLPTLVSSYFPSDVEVIFHSENGILNFGRLVLEEEKQDPDLVNASGQPITLEPGASFFDSAAAFGMIRGGRIDVAVLGAYQVSETGDIANWAQGQQVTGVGGAMDLCCGVKKVLVIMEHTTQDGQPRIRRKCTYPLTALNVVSTIFTNLAVIDVTQRGLVLREVAPGVTVEEVQLCTEARLILSEDLQEMSL